MKKLLWLFFLPVVACADYNKVTVNDVSSGVGQFNTLQGTGTAITTYQVPGGNTLEFQNTSTLKVDAWILSGVVVNNASGVLSSLTGSNGQFLGYSGGVLGFSVPTAAAGGSTGQIQYNSSSAIAGASGFTFSSGTGDVVNSQNFAGAQEYLGVYNTSTNAAGRAIVNIGNSVHNLQLITASTANSSAILTNGPSTEQAVIGTSSSIPLVFGTNGAASFYLDGTTQKPTFPTQIVSTVTTGTAPLSVASTTNVPNLNASSLNGATFASPGSIGSTTPGSGAFTTLSASSGLNSTAVGNTTPSTGAFTTLSASSTVSGAGFTSLFAAPPPIGSTTANSGAFTTLSATQTNSGSTGTGIVLVNTASTSGSGVGIDFDPVNTSTLRARIRMSLDGGGSGVIALLTGVGTTAGLAQDSSGNVTFAQSALSSSATAGVGYTTGSGGTVTQATSRSTGVSLNTVTGQITGNNASLAASTAVTFTVTDSAVGANDFVDVKCISGGSSTTIYDTFAVSAGSFVVREINVNTTTADTTTPVLRFVVIKSSNN